MQTKRKPMIREQMCVFVHGRKQRQALGWYLVQIKIYLFCYWINKLSENNRFSTLVLVLFFHAVSPPFYSMQFRVVCILCRTYIHFSFLDNIFGHFANISLLFCSLWNGTNAIFYTPSLSQWNFVYCVWINKTNTIFLQQKKNNKFR